MMNLVSPKRESLGESRYNSDNLLASGTVDFELTKAKQHAAAPKGFNRIPKSKHQGYRKKVGDHYAYWYPDAHKGEPHLDWEDDVGAGRGTSLIQAGHFVAKIGERGKIYAWTPDARKADADPAWTWVTPVDPESGHPTGQPVRVKSDRLQPQRSFALRTGRPKGKKKQGKQPKWRTRHDPVKLAAREKKKREGTLPRRGPAGTADALEATSRRERQSKRNQIAVKIAEAQEMLDRTGRKRVRSPDRRAALQAAIVAGRKELENVREQVGGPGRMTDRPNPNIQSAMFEGSTAKAGTILHDLENGKYALVEYNGDDEHFEHGKRTHGIFLPPQDVVRAFDEFSDVFDNAALRVARTHRVSSGPELDEVRSGARLGFMLALRTYTGGVPFEVHSRRYAHVYAGLAARDVKSGGGAQIPTRQMQMIHGLIAARARATAEAGKTPTDEQVAKAWHITKSATFTGRVETLGTYPHPTRKGSRVDQGREQVPLGSWKVLGPDGEPHGREYGGKLALIREIDPILDGSRVEDTEWMNMNEGQIAPTGIDPTMPLGSRYQIRREVDKIFADMPADKVEVLTALFGLDPVDAATADLEQDDDAGRRVNPLHVITAVELSDRLGLAPPDASIRDKQRKAKVEVASAINLFRIKAENLGFRHIADRSRNWNRMIAPRRAEKIPAPTGPSHGELAERFGGDDKVAIYGSAVRAGNGTEVAKKLERWKAGKLSAKQRDNVMKDYIVQRDRERLAAFHRQTAHRTVDPSEVYDVGPGTGTPQEADWLYTPEILAGALHAAAKLPAPGKGGSKQSTVWSDSKFAQFMGRGRQFERTQTKRESAKPKAKPKSKRVKKGGDNG